MKGYKAFNNDLTCRDYQFTEGAIHVYDGEVFLCESGFHFCTELQDVVKYYCSKDMRVFEIEASGFITEPEHECSKRACAGIKLVKELSLDEVKNAINLPEAAFHWANGIGNREEMKKFIKNSIAALRWARDIGDREEMKPLITDSNSAYGWGLYIGDREEMKTLITDPHWAYMWAVYMGDVEYMLGKYPELKGKV